MSRFKFEGTYDDKKGNHIDPGLTLLAFQEDKIHFVYSPAFDLTGYGRTEEEASNSFRIALDEFLRYTVNKNTLYNELERLGWNVKKKITKAPSIEDLAASNKYLAEILKEKDYKKIQETVKLPAYA
jgi:hypothetical protein